MSISKSDVELIASLAKLTIEDKAIRNYQTELKGIVQLIGQMQSIDTSTVEPMSHPQDIELRLRADKVTELDQKDELQAVAPATEGGLYLVPKVLD